MGLALAARLPRLRCPPDLRAHVFLIFYLCWLEAAGLALCSHVWFLKDRAPPRPRRAGCEPGGAVAALPALGSAGGSSLLFVLDAELLRSLLDGPREPPKEAEAVSHRCRPTPAGSPGSWDQHHAQADRRWSESPFRHEAEVWPQVPTQS